MKCSASQTTCTVPEQDRQRFVTAAFEALVFGEILKPLAAGLGPLGEIVVDAAAQRAFVDAPVETKR
jgi:hypothetical protein